MNAKVTYSGEEVASLVLERVATDFPAPAGYRWDAKRVRRVNYDDGYECTLVSTQDTDTAEVTISGVPE